MRFLTYAGVEPGPLRVAFDRVRGAIEREDLRGADVKKRKRAVATPLR